MNEHRLSTSLGSGTSGSELSMHPWSVHHGSRDFLRSYGVYEYEADSELDRSQGRLSLNMLLGFALAVMVSIGCWTVAWLMLQRLLN